MADFERIKKGEYGYIKGTWDGNPLEFKDTWSGHEFTDEEASKLLDGEELTVECVSKAGKKFKCVCALGPGEFNGRSGIWVQRVRFVNDGPTSWCKYAFTDAEKADLLAGKTVKGTKFVGQSGRQFSAEVKWDPAEGKVVLVDFLKK